MKVDIVCDQGSGKVNEDAFLAKFPLLAVFDGASSLVDWTDEYGRTGGQRAVQLTKEVFSIAKGSLKNRVLSANTKLQEAMDDAGIDTSQKENRWACTLAAILFEDDRIQYAQVGDSLILGIYQNGACQLITPYYDHDLETMLMWKERSQKKMKNLWRMLLPQTIKVRRQANVVYGVLNGEAGMQKFVNAGPSG